MLNNALDCGITEKEFWEMTFAELDRLLESKRRVYTIEAKERATHNYVLAIMIGRAMSGGDYPDISEFYPSLYNAQEQETKKQEQLELLSALRFKQFADSYNKKFKEVANDK